MNLARTVIAALATLAVLSPAAALAAPTAPSAPSAPSARAGSTPTGHTEVIADCQQRRTEPRVIESACGDANEYAVVTRYAFWHGDAARGRGRLVVNDCTPDCARGHFHRYPATFRLGAVRHPKAGPVFSRIRVSYVMDGRTRHTTLFPPTRPL